MKKLRQISSVVVLNLMLVTGAFAGIIHTGDDPPPPPDPPAATVPGIIYTGTPTPSDQQNLTASSDGFTEVAVSLLQQLLSVL